MSRVAWAGGLLVALVGLALFRSPLGEGLERWSYDLPFQFFTNGPVTDVVVIYMDEASHRELGQRFDRAWDRGLHTKLLKRLTLDSASLIFFDVVFSDPDPDPQKDTEFAAAIRESGHVILSATADTNGMHGPTPALAKAAAGVGLIEFPREDAASGVRRLWTHVKVGATNYPTAAWLAATNLNTNLITRTPPADAWLRYSATNHAAIATDGLQQGELPWMSYAAARKTSPGYFAGKAVFIGGRPQVGFIGARLDEFPNVFTWHNKRYSPGVEIHATAVWNLWRNQWLRRFPKLVELGVLLVGGFAAGWGLSRLRPLPMTEGRKQHWWAVLYSRLGRLPLLPVVGLALAGMVIVFGAALFLFGQRLWFSWLTLAGVQIPLALSWTVVWHAVRAHVERRVLEESLSRYVAPRRVQQLLARPELLQPRADKQIVSILFSDIRASSKIAERKRPEELTQLLNDYYQTALGCIHDSGGTVMRLAGDSIFALWNAPEAQPDHAALACRAALLLQDRLAEFDRTRNDLPLPTRVGLHTGPACVGNIGSAERFEYSALGAAVNLAARLEGLNDKLGTQILISGDICVESAKQGFLGRLMGHFKLKGFDQVIEVHELLGRAERENETRAWREAFAQALKHFQRQQFDEAQEQFERARKLRAGGDGPSAFYLEQIPALRAARADGKLPKTWIGEIILDSK